MLGRVNQCVGRALGRGRGQRFTAYNGSLRPFAAFRSDDLVLPGFRGRCPRGIPTSFRHGVLRIVAWSNNTLSKKIPVNQAVVQPNNTPGNKKAVLLDRPMLFTQTTV